MLEKSPFRKNQRKIALITSICIHLAWIGLTSLYVIFNFYESPPSFTSTLKIGLEPIDQDDKTTPFKMITHPKMEMYEGVEEEDEFIVELPFIDENVIAKSESSFGGTITYSDIVEFEPLDDVLNMEESDLQRSLVGFDSNDQPELIYQPPPQYPDSLKKRNINGQVTVKFLVDSSGETEDIEIIESSHRGFNRAVLSAIAEWKFESNIKSSSKAKSEMQITIKFVI